MFQKKERERDVAAREDAESGAGTVAVASQAFTQGRTQPMGRVGWSPPNFFEKVNFLVLKK